MKRTLEQWELCDPKAMARDMSEAAIMYALEDAKADILELHKEMLRFKNIARAVAYPQRGRPEGSYNLMDFAKVLQSAYTAEQLWVEEKDR